MRQKVSVAVVLACLVGGFVVVGVVTADARPQRIHTEGPVEVTITQGAIALGSSASGTNVVRSSGSGSQSLCSSGNYAAQNEQSADPSEWRYGAWEIQPWLWNNAAAEFGLTGLIGVRPDQASQADQDQMAEMLVSTGNLCR